MKSEVVEPKEKFKEEFKEGFYQTDDGLVVYMKHPGVGPVMVAACGWDVFDSSDDWDMTDFTRCPVETQVILTQE
jgi:hypothetical protein